LELHYIPLDHVPEYVKQKLEEKEKIHEQIKEADETLQSKNVNIQAINEHLALNEKLKEHGLSTQDIDKLLKILANAARYGFDGNRNCF
jgi:alcohol dehydrogenase class IV